MADYSAASANANSALTSSVDGFVEEYEITKDGRKVKRGSLAGQIQAAAMLNGLAARQSNGLFRVAKFRNPRP